MQPYADEDFYQNTYLSGRGAVITAAFSFYAMQATAEIRRYIGEHAEDDSIQETVRYCCCEIAELLFCDELAVKSSGGVSSESVQGWSKSYESTDARKMALRQAIKACIYKWLGDTGLLYRG